MPRILSVKSIIPGNRGLICLLACLLASYLPSSASATTYFDAESGTDGWSIFDGRPDGASFSTVSDESLASQVIQTDGAGRDNSYLLGGTSSDDGWNNTTQFTLEWKMATSELFDILVYIETSDGRRRLTYSQSNIDLLDNPTNDSIGFGFTNAVMDGQWRTYQRDLAADLAIGEPGLQLIAVNGFMIRASLRVDDISLTGGDGEEPTPPTAIVNADTTTGTAPLTVSFDGASSTAVTPATLTTFLWDFGNGFVANTPSASTTYTQSGNYTASLTVTDSNGLSHTQSRTISVNNNSSDMCDGFINTAERVVIPSRNKPPYLNYYNDPAFGAKVIRISDSQFGEVRKPIYSTMQAWNADESLLMLYRTGGGAAHHLLLDGHTYEPVRVLDISPSDLEEVFWSHSDPDTFYYVSNRSPDRGQFKRYSVSTGDSTRITDFGAYCGAATPSSGNDVHMQSLDDDLFGFRCQRSDGSYRMLSYRISTDTVTSATIGSGSRWSPYTAPMPGPSGERFWYQGASLGTDLTTVERVMDMGNPNEHSSLGQTHNGQDALYQTGFNVSPGGCDGAPYAGVGHLVEHNLETGACRPIISQAQGYTYTTSSTHISAQAYRRPGWIAMSSIGSRAQYDYFTNNAAAPPLLSEIYLANTDPDEAVTCRLAHHRSYGKQATQGGYAPYFGEPHATISPTGTRILFGSDWYDSGSVDSYVIELPGYEQP